MSKVSWKDMISRDFNKHFLKINLLLWEKVVLHTATLAHCKVRQVLRDLFNANQVNGSEIRFVAGVTKINLKNLKIYLWLDDVMQETI